MKPKYQNMSGLLPSMGSLRPSQSQVAIAKDATPMPREMEGEKHIFCQAPGRDPDAFSQGRRAPG